MQSKDWRSSPGAAGCPSVPQIRKISRLKQHELAKAKLKKNQELTALMRQAVDALDEKKTIQISELPHEYYVQMAKVVARGVGICLSCRFESSCLRCNEAVPCILAEERA